MPGKTEIQWTDMSWNPMHPGRLDAPLHWRKPRRIFVNCMSDLFHENVPDKFIHRVFAVMALAPHHIFQILTKRPERMLAYLLKEGNGDVEEPDSGWLVGSYAHLGIEAAGDDITESERYGFTTGHLEDMPWPLPNVWLGVSVENQRYADERLPLLAQCPAAVRFVSIEPLLGPVILADACNDWLNDHDAVDWIIVGGESGPGHRPMKVEWIQKIADDCTAAGVALWVKQDSGPRPGQQGRLPDSLWARKEMP